MSAGPGAGRPLHVTSLRQVRTGNAAPFTSLHSPGSPRGAPPWSPKFLLENVCLRRRDQDTAAVATWMVKEGALWPLASRSLGMTLRLFS